MPTHTPTHTPTPTTYNSLTLLPAYGRDYSSKASLLADWLADKDFYATPTQLVPGGYGAGTSGYVNRQQVPALKTDGYTHLHFRYAKQTKVYVLSIHLEAN